MTKILNSSKQRSRQSNIVLDICGLLLFLSITVESVKLSSSGSSSKLPFASVDSIKNILDGTSIGEAPPLGEKSNRLDDDIPDDLLAFVIHHLYGRDDLEDRNENDLERPSIPSTDVTIQVMKKDIPRMYKKDSQTAGISKKSGEGSRTYKKSALPRMYKKSSAIPRIYKKSPLPRMYKKSTLPRMYKRDGEIPMMYKKAGIPRIYKKGGVFLNFAVPEYVLDADYTEDLSPLYRPNRSAMPRVYKKRMSSGVPRMYKKSIHAADSIHLIPEMINPRLYKRASFIKKMLPRMYRRSIPRIY